MLGLNGFTPGAVANLPSKPHPSLQPGVLQVTVIFQFAVIHVVVSEFSGTISTLCQERSLRVLSEFVSWFVPSGYRCQRCQHSYEIRGLVHR